MQLIAGPIVVWQILASFYYLYSNFYVVYIIQLLLIGANGWQTRIEAHANGLFDNGLPQLHFVRLRHIAQSDSRGSCYCWCVVFISMFPQEFPQEYITFLILLFLKKKLGPYVIFPPGIEYNQLNNLEFFIAIVFFLFCILPFIDRLWSVLAFQMFANFSMWRQSKSFFSHLSQFHTVHVYFIIREYFGTLRVSVVNVFTSTRISVFHVFRVAPWCPSIIISYAQATCTSSILMWCTFISESYFTWFRVERRGGSAQEIAAAAI